MITNERLIEVIGNAIKTECIGFYVDSAFLESFNIEDDDVEEFLGKYCVSRGTEEDVLNYFYDKCLEEFERRMNFFECLNNEAYQFLSYEIMSYLLHPSVTMNGPATFYSSFIDDISADDDMHCCVKIDDEYFVFNFDDTDFKYRIDEKYLFNFEIEKHIETIRKKLTEYINNNMNNR